MYSNSLLRDHNSSDASTARELCQFDLFSWLNVSMKVPRMCLPDFWFENFVFITIDSNTMKKKNQCCHSTFTLNMLRWSVSVTNIQKVVRYTWLSRKTCNKDEIRYCQHNTISIITVLQNIFSFGEFIQSPTYSPSQLHMFFSFKPGDSAPCPWCTDLTIQPPLVFH